MTTLKFSLHQLRGMIGVVVSYEGQRFQVIEVLEDGPYLVLQHSEDTSLQPDQHGDPRRRVPHTVTIPVFEKNGSEFHSRLLSLDLIES